MEEFSKFGVSFKRLDLEHLEMVRQWRNSDDVRLYMQYQKIISPEEHLAWFHKINNEKNFYFVAYEDGKPFGLYNIKDIDYDKGQGEGGVFLKNKTYWEGSVSIRGSFLLSDFFFNVLKLNQMVAHVLKSNKKVLNYNKQLGFTICNDFDNEFSYFLVLNKDSFYNKRNLQLIKFLEK